jgi:hypothetical protein
LSHSLTAIVVAFAVFASGALWLEQSHRIIIDAPDALAPSVPTAPVCPENDTLPYDSRCLDFLNARAEQPAHLRVVTVVYDARAAAACPDNDTVPYSADCIAFLKGATESGMRWRATASETPATALH